MRTALLAASVVFATGGVAVGGLAAPEEVSGPARPASTGAELPRLLGFSDQKLVGVDAETLRPAAGRRLPIGSGGCAPRTGGTACWTHAPWTVSPDGSALAVARNDAGSVLVVDPSRLRVRKEIGPTGEVGALAWLAPGRLLVVQEVAGEQQRLLALHPATGRVARRALGGSVTQLGRTARELVLLVAPARKIGPARIAVADRRGVVRFVRLPSIAIGTKLLGTGSRHSVDARQPSLAVDPVGRRAFVVAQSVVAEVDLRKLTVAYRTLKQPASLLSRLWSWLEPVASAKQTSGYHRVARWLGGDRLAVSGTDAEQGKIRYHGLRIVDTRTWSVQTADQDAAGFVVTADLLLVWGDGIGLAAFGFDGEKRFHLFDDANAWPELVHRDHAYVRVAGVEPLQIVDLAAGTVVGVRAEPLPRLLIGPGSGWWEY
jgi:hypothetical protein